jgi:hypothetical protein
MLLGQSGPRSDARTLGPALAFAAETLNLECTLSELVNRACVLTPATESRE